MNNSKERGRQRVAFGPLTEELLPLEHGKLASWRGGTLYDVGQIRYFCATFKRSSTAWFRMAEQSMLHVTQCCTYHNKVLLIQFVFHFVASLQNNTTLAQKNKQKKNRLQVKFCFSLVWSGRSDWSAQRPDFNHVHQIWDCNGESAVCQVLLISTSRGLR